ncbi:MAG: chorismate pyruvate-lyase family protein [Methanoregulaceae archaeon]|nr:chorismate pyruvate-lyase family protein [Methanoregulaceae archaeon]
MPVSFQAIEKEQGTLSTLQKILLSTDGSVTSLLEAIEGEEVTITTLSQEVVPADANTASELDIRAGSEVNHRVVELKNSRTGAVLIFAVSDTPLERLEPGFKSDLMRADIPIGRILAKHSIESRREISDMGVRASDRAMSRIFGVPEKDPLLFRKYRIIRQGKPFISIEEVFPGSSFCAGSGVLVSAPSRLHLGLIDLNGAFPGRSSRQRGRVIVSLQEGIPNQPGGQEIRFIRCSPHLVLQEVQGLPSGQNLPDMSALVPAPHSPSP